MLQGDDRLDRFYKFRRHLLDVASNLYNPNLNPVVADSHFHQKNIFTSSLAPPPFPLHSVLYVPLLGHDPTAMVQSSQGRCALFGFQCDNRQLLQLGEDLMVG
jgi:hypothetical protein